MIKSPQVAARLGVNYWRLMNLLRSRKIPPPPKDSSGDYVWSKRHVEAAKKALDRKASPIE